MAFDSLVINLIMLIPTMVFALFVEKHYTAFWTGFWNLFALGVTGIAMLLSPPLKFSMSIEIGMWRFLPLILIFVGFGMMAFSYYLESALAGILGSSHITASLLSATYLFQYTVIPAVFVGTLIISLIAIYIGKVFLP